jgi:hypothetical protein
MQGQCCCLKGVICALPPSYRNHRPGCQKLGRTNHSKKHTTLSSLVLPNVYSIIFLKNTIVVSDVTGRTTSEIGGLSPQDRSRDSRRSENAQTHIRIIQ